MPENYTRDAALTRATDLLPFGETDGLINLAEKIYNFITKPEDSRRPNGAPGTEILAKIDALIENYCDSSLGGVSKTELVHILTQVREAVEAAHPEWGDVNLRALIDERDDLTVALGHARGDFKLLAASAEETSEKLQDVLRERDRAREVAVLLEQETRRLEQQLETARKDAIKGVLLDLLRSATQTPSELGDGAVAQEAVRMAAKYEVAL